MIYVLQHHPAEQLGLISGIMNKLNLPFRELALYEGDGLPRNTSDLRGLVIMGGPMNVDETVRFPFLREEVSLIEKILADGKPVLGICLGAQLIAKALGARVYAHHTKEVGWGPVELTEEAKNDPRFVHIPQRFQALHWHGDTFELPHGSKQVAKSKVCDNQAFVWNDVACGLQFHLEATAAMVEQWCEDASSKDFLKAARTKPRDILKNNTTAATTLKPIAEQFFRNYFSSAYSILPTAV